MSATATPSRTLISVVQELHAREAVGLAKYGTTVDRSDLTQAQWLQHAKEEAMDLTLYLSRALEEAAKAAEVRSLAQTALELLAEAIHVSVDEDFSSMARNLLATGASLGLRSA